VKIYKYPISQLGVTELDLPSSSVILSTGLDLSRVLCIWALVNPDNPTKEYKIETVFTGQEPEVCQKFLGTVTGELVYHVFTA
jgi:hypothetical protein